MIDISPGTHAAACTNIFFLFALKKQAKDAPFSDVSIIYNRTRLFIKSSPDAKTKFFTNFYEFYN